MSFDWLLLTNLLHTKLQRPPILEFQFVWVCLVIAVLGAIGMAMEAPTEDLYKRKPYPRHQHLVSPTMLKNFLLHSAYQIFIIFLLYGLGMYYLLYELGMLPMSIVLINEMFYTSYMHLICITFSMNLICLPSLWTSYVLPSQWTLYLLPPQRTLYVLYLLYELDMYYLLNELGIFAYYTSSMNFVCTPPLWTWFPLGSW